MEVQMDQDHDHQHQAVTGSTDLPGGRRKFLRQVGMTAAATAAFAGIGDVAGMKAAGAATKVKPTSAANKDTLVRALPVAELPAVSRKKVQEIRLRHGQEKGENPDAAGAMYCFCDPNHCPGACHPNGVWCHYCYYWSGGYCGPSGYYCIEGCGSGFFCP
jgi:hypothetical protein